MFPIKGLGMVVRYRCNYMLRGTGRSPYRDGWIERIDRMDKPLTEFETTGPAVPDEGDIDLRTFFPYLVRVYYRAVSSSVSDVYTSLYGLSVAEWRTMTVLGPHRAVSASVVASESSMDKVAVSRAIARLKEKKYLRQDINGEDRRFSVVSLTEEGRGVYRDLVPRVRDIEQKLLAGLSGAERDTLKSLMEKVRMNADALANSE